MRNILVVFNNKSGRKRAFSYNKLIFKKFKANNINFKFIFIDVLKFVKNIEIYDTILAVGGDGTVNSVLPYVVNKNVSFGILPVGTGNLLAYDLNIPTNIAKAVDIVINGKTKMIDSAKINDEFFILRTGLGFDAEVICNTPQWMKNLLGYFAYFFHGFLSFLFTENKFYKIKYDDKNLIVASSMIIIANTGLMYKNLVTTTPDSKLDDGKFDLCIVKSRNLWDSILIFLKILLKVKMDFKKIKYKKFSKLDMEFSRQKVHIDGEPDLKKEELHIEVLPDSVKIITI